MKRNMLILLLAGIAMSSFAQSREGYIFEVASRIRLFLPADDLAVVQGSGKYVQIGMMGAENDVDEMSASFDRFILHDKDMIIRVESIAFEENIHWFRFYLSPLADPNDVGLMLDMHRFTTFSWKNNPYPVKEYASVVFNWAKENNKFSDKN